VHIFYSMLFRILISSFFFFKIFCQVHIKFINFEILIRFNNINFGNKLDKFRDNDVPTKSFEFYLTL